MGECTAEDKRECYVPMPSLGHELGILFGFLGMFQNGSGQCTLVGQ